MFVCCIVAALIVSRAEAQANPPGGVFRQEGVASWYGNEFNGRPTASGEIFNSSLFTAAHPSLPFGTFLLVTNRNNNRQVSVRVNDRGPFVGGRIIDLSRAAAEHLDMLITGTAQVVIETFNGQAQASEPPQQPWQSPQTQSPAQQPPQPQTQVQTTSATVPLDVPPNTPITVNIFHSQDPTQPPTVVVTPTEGNVPEEWRFPQPPAQQQQPSQQFPQQAQPVPPPPTVLPTPAPLPPPQQQYSQPPAVTQPPAATQPQPAPAPQQWSSQQQPPAQPQPQPQPAQQWSSQPAQPQPSTQPQPSAQPPVVQQPWQQSPTNQAAINPNATYRVQVGSFKVARNAVDVFVQLRSANLQPSYERHDDFFRVVLASIRGSEVQATVERLASLGFPGVIVMGE